MRASVSGVAGQVADDADLVADDDPLAAEFAGPHGGDLDVVDEHACTGRGRR